MQFLFSRVSLSKAMLYMRLVCCMLFAANTAFAQAYPHLQVSGRFLKSPCGDTIILRGINYAPYNWGYTLADERMNQIVQTGANAVRIAWYVTAELI